VTIKSGALAECVDRPDDPGLRLLIGSAAFLVGRTADMLPGFSPNNEYGRTLWATSSRARE